MFDSLNVVLSDIVRSLLNYFDGSNGYKGELETLIGSLGKNGYFSDKKDKFVSVIMKSSAPDARKPPFDQDEVPRYIGIYPER